MYDEYTTPKVKVHITARNVMNFFMWVAGLAITAAIIFGLAVTLLNADTKQIEGDTDNDCLIITYEKNSAFEADRDLSGIYCKEDSENFSN